jgi:predicted dinucleotide-binding enzyme
MKIGVLGPGMVDPSRVAGEHDVFYCGDDEDAKEGVADLLESFGWKEPIDLGPLASARGMEGMMPFWLRMWKTLGTVDFNFRIARARQ